MALQFIYHYQCQLFTEKFLILENIDNYLA